MQRYGTSIGNTESSFPTVVLLTVTVSSNAADNFYIEYLTLIFKVFWLLKLQYYTGSRLRVFALLSYIIKCLFLKFTFD